MATFSLWDRELEYSEGEIDARSREPVLACGSCVISRVEAALHCSATGRGSVEQFRVELPALRHRQHDVGVCLVPSRTGCLVGH